MRAMFFYRVLTSVLLSCCAASIAIAQTQRSIIGAVFDETGAVLPGVMVELIADAGVETTITDDTGSYRFDGIGQSQVVVSFRLINFSQTTRDIELTEAEQRVDVVLTLGMAADVVVTGSRTFRNIADLENPRENLVGVASSASVGAITAEQLASRPIMRPGEVLEAVPGFIASQHSGEGKANQYYLRGFNLDHGSDFATTLAGVPMNESSGAHAHGYSDVNLLIPELVSGVQYTKGPYFAEHGDFSAAGSANISYLNVLDRPMFSVSTGGDGWGRVFGAVSPKLGEGNLLVALELTKNDGPWELPDDLKKTNGVIRYSQGDTRNGYSFTAMGYSADWNSTDQIPLRAVNDGSITRFGNLDPTDGGSTKRYSLAFDSLVSSGNQSTRVTVYGLRGRLNLFQNFTYFLADPVNGDQVEQEGTRGVYGGKVVHRRLGQMLGRHIESSVGVSTRHDNVGSVGLYPTVTKQRIGVHRQDRVQQTTFGVFAQSEVEWTDRFRTTLGLRGDGYRYSVDAIRSLNDGQGTSGLVSPKLTAVFGPWAGSEIYANYGRGYHSNDPRAAITRIDPISGGPVDSASPIVPARGSEIGFRSVALPRLQSTLALWYLSFDSELVFVGDAGIAEASRPSRRYGVEWTNYINLTDWLTGELDMSFSDSRFSDFDVAGSYIPGALDRVIAGGLTVSQSQRLFGSIRLRHFGARPLIEDYSVKSAPTTILNGEVGFRLNERLNVVFEAFNLLNSDVSDIDYYYASRLPGEPLAGVDDVHFHPSLPRTARVMLNVSF